MTGLIHTDPLPYCSGCGHSRLHHLLAEVLASLGYTSERLWGVHGGGCSQLIGDSLAFPWSAAPPGLALAMATGIKHAAPDKLVLTYQGDGDLAGRGLDALMHAALRGENLTVLCLNNLVMAGSGGQMSATTVTGQVTRTSRLGRSSTQAGKPLRLTELVARLPNVAFAQRVSLHSFEHIERARTALKDAFLYQENGQGLSFVEVMGPCPPYWGLTPLEARDKLGNELLRTHPPGIYKRVTMIR